MQNTGLIVAKNPRKSFFHFFLRTLIGPQAKIGWLEMLCKIISEIQIIATLLYFPFQVMNNSTTDSFGYFVQKISQYISLYDVFDLTKSNWVNNIIYALTNIYLIILCAFVILFYVYYRLKRQVPNELLKIWNILGVIHYTVLFQITYQYSLNIIRYKDNDAFLLMANEDNLPFTIIAALRLSFGPLFALIFCKFLYMPMKSEYIAAKRTCIPDLLILLFKIVDIPLNIFFESITAQKWLRMVIMVLLFVPNIRFNSSCLPYFHYWPMKLSISFSFIHLSLTISNIIMVILGDTRGVNSFSSVYLSTIMILFAVKLADFILKRIIKNSSFDVITITSKNDFYRKLFALDYILSKGVSRLQSVQSEPKRREKYYDCIFYGIVSQHKKRCSRPVCGCQIVSQNIHSKSEHSIDTEYHLLKSLKFELNKELYREGLKKMPLNFEIRIGFAHFLFETKTYSDGASISLIHALDAVHKTLEMKVISSMLLESIEKKIEQNNDHSINIKEVIDYQFLSSELRSKIETNSAKLLGFWETYKASDLSIVKLYSISVQMEKEAKKIGSIWDKITRKYAKLAHQDYLFYGLFMSLVRNAPNSAHKILMKYFSVANKYNAEDHKEALISSENLHDPNNVYVYITMKREKMGVIHYITSNVENVLYYNTQEVMDKNIAMLMPPYFQERHKKYLFAHIEKGRTSILNKNSALFSQRRDGYMIPVTVYVNIFPYFQEQLLYVGIIRPMQTFDEFLLVLDDGTIDAFTPGIGRKLHLNPLLSRMYHLKDISKELAKFHKIFLPFVKEEAVRTKSLVLSAKNISRTQTYLNYYATNIETIADLSRKIESVVIKEGKEDEFKKQRTNSRSSTRAEELSKLYDNFITAGVMTYYTPLNDGDEGPMEDKVAYNTIIIEKIIQGSHVRIYQLHALVTEDEDDDIRRTVNKLDTSKSRMTMGEPLLTQKTEKILTHQDHSRLASSIPSDDSIKYMDKEDEINFRNPFSEDGEPQETLMSPKELASPKDPLLPSSGGGSNRKSVANPGIANVLASESKRNSYRFFMPDSNPRMVNNMNNKATMLQQTIRRASARITYRVDKEPEKDESINSNKTQTSVGKGDKRQRLDDVGLKNFLKENRILAAVNHGNDPADRGSVTSSVKTNKINSRLESAIFFTEKSFATRALTLAISLFCAVSVGLLGYIQNVTSYNLDRIKNNVEVLELSYERLFYVLEANRRARRIDFIQRGLAPIQRHPGVPDYAIFNQNALGDVSKNLSARNSEMRNSIYKIDASEHDRFYNQISVRSREDLTKIRKADTFDLCTELAYTGLEIYNMRPTKPSVGDMNVEFILNNTLNDLLNESQDVVLILRADNNISLGKVQDTMIGVLGGILGVFLVIFIALAKTEVDFISAKAHFIDVFLMIKDHEIEMQLYMVNNFHTSLKENKKETQFLEKLLDDRHNLKAKIANAKKGDMNTFKAKKANCTGVNRPSYFNIAFGFLFLSVYWLLFGTILGIFIGSKSSLNNFRRKTIDAKINHFNYGLALAGLYEYITENGASRLLMSPSGPRWEAIYLNLTQTMSYLATFADPSATLHEEIGNLLTGNLCNYGTLFADRACTSEVTGVASRGLLAVDTSLLTYMRSVKDYYDSSNRTTEAMKEALTLSDLLNAEILYEVYSKRGYRELDKFMLQSFWNEVDSFLRYTTGVIIGSGVILVVLTIVCWVYLRRRMSKERVRYRRMLRAIPVSVFLTNRFLKSYLMSHSGKILDSVKNRI